MADTQDQGQVQQPATDAQAPAANPELTIADLTN